MDARVRLSSRGQLSDHPGRRCVTTALLLRHETGHCNGWPSDHPGQHPYDAKTRKEKMKWPRSANDVVFTILILASPRRWTRPSSTSSLPAARLLSLDRLLLPLSEQLRQRGQSCHRQSRAPLQSVEQAGKAALGNELAGALQIGPDRSAGRR